jgi:hypothetical protein
MKGRPSPERIPLLKREAYRIYAQYDLDPDGALLQHCFIADLMARDHAQGEPVDPDEEDEDDGL